MTVKEEIDSMLKSLTDVTEPVSEPESSPEPMKEEPKDEGSSVEVSSGTSDNVSEDSSKVEKGDKEGSEELPSDRTDTVQVSDTAPVKEPEPEHKPDERDRTISELQAKINELTTTKEVKKEEPKPLDEQDFVGEVDLDELTRDPKEFNKVLNKIYQKAVMDTRSSVVETLPDIVKTNIQIMNELKATSDRFYEENKDLKPFKKVVSVVFDELAASNPTKPYNDLIKEVGPEVRKRLDIKETKEVPVKKTESPKLPQKGGRVGRSDKPTIEPLQAELEEMNRVIGR